ncbi:MAG: thioesterase [Armatimonadetes bacterium]|jgi:acyl-CoA thioester hydrolase|nr:thioesterase [Armatimonadota bacterium]
MSHLFTLEFEVRDYECDLQGIVNNAVYQNYLEHCRHVFLKSRGVDFAALAAAGVNLVLVRAELDYLLPLRPGDRFVVGLDMERVSRLRFAFIQTIYRLPDERAVVRARFIGTGINAAGRPSLPAEVERLLAECLPAE